MNYKLNTIDFKYLVGIYKVEEYLMKVNNKISILQMGCASLKQKV